MLSNVEILSHLFYILGQDHTHINFVVFLCFFETISCISEFGYHCFSLCMTLGVPDEGSAERVECLIELSSLPLLWTEPDEVSPSANSSCSI